ncbi:MULTISPECIES: methyltransferase type 11 [unclassified Brevundimonas]|uniref:methyltransferase type 11 n=1 Tax=unclassified Brevundimonas TaxID=2622653 RepID=UPI000CFD7999|nr:MULTISPECIES: methyltransferase type 11 [unclassified Brevundimonas]PRA26881.1 methyltransferase type 11 [Brevundimonas sp. MYb27]PQZ76964.1 methyltransferase type 11 [Brevundimonas sp. MYb31]PRB11842.1 methyltransferase type 11 [Brevundimonas sp. MYb52]PRB32826.1 methyltransferase type 11 [Brevundimonas sp. MYb46]PRB47269.1 methyltransferase type 11 [Brevundimonas sp. MYb33]
MHHLLWPACALALMTAACDNGGTVRITTTSSGKDVAGVLKVVDALQCPQTQGVLTRKGSARADGATCVYSGPRGSEVTLHLVALNGGSVQDALKGFENRLSADLPEALAEARASEDRARAEAARAEADAARAEADAERAGAEAERAAAQAEAAADATADSAHISAPGVRIDAQGDKATVRLPGMHIDADGDRANIRIGGITIRADDKNSQVNVRTNSGSSSDADAVAIDANDSGARIRTSSPGEAVRATFMMTADQSSSTGWRVVGYEARGPSGGPIVVATVRGKDRNENRVFEAAKALVTLNVGD